ncbi:hypothetical protein [Brevundimonas sp. TWP2-3-4b1]|uniref:hypothetical protein n=1 Tax=Brevundimonas sp. TWP2-3-4b1 TaxID=2804580 RepID=UPI003CFB005A
MVCERDAWVAEVDRVMKRDWCIDTADVGLSEEEVERYWRDDNPPDLFVAWFAEKYDLVRFEPLRGAVRTT